MSLLSKPFNALGIGGIVVGILGIFGPIAWDLYKTKTELEIRASELSVIIGGSARVEGLSVQYRGESLDRLAKATVLVTNTGRTPILQKDVVRPLTISFSPDSNVVDAQVDNLSPAGLQADLIYDRAGNKITISAPLLNPGDRISLAILLKSQKLDFDATARISGLSTLSISKDFTSPSDLVSVKKSSWLIYLAGTLSFIFAIVSIGGFRNWPAERKAKQEFRDGTFQFPQDASRYKLIAWVDEKFFFCTDDERKLLKDAIDRLPDDANFTVTHDAELRRLFAGILGSITSNLAMALVALFLAVSGLLYVTFAVAA